MPALPVPRPHPSAARGRGPSPTTCISGSWTWQPFTPNAIRDGLALLAVLFTVRCLWRRARAGLQPRPPSAIDSFMRRPNPDYTRAAPKRRSYHRVLPVGAVAAPQPPALDVGSAGPRPDEPPVPPAPHPRLLDLDGEIISAMDRHGTEWTRHTRVYGGEFCPACAAGAAVRGGGDLTGVYSGFR
ncbi:hypothetical protein E4U53_001600 [Claviceps sorghi]|nr:hypothetical protein E4U53_001600 [Claviceps sorghi]